MFPNQIGHQPPQPYGAQPAPQAGPSADDAFRNQFKKNMVSNLFCGLPALFGAMGGGGSGLNVFDPSPAAPPVPPPGSRQLPVMRQDLAGKNSAKRAEAILRHVGMVPSQPAPDQQAMFSFLTEAIHGLDHRDRPVPMQAMFGLFHVAAGNPACEHALNRMDELLAALPPEQRMAALSAGVADLPYVAPHVRNLMLREMINEVARCPMTPEKPGMLLWLAGKIPDMPFSAPVESVDPMTGLASVEEVSAGVAELRPAAWHAALAATSTLPPEQVWPEQVAPILDSLAFNIACAAEDPAKFRLGLQRLGACAASLPPHQQRMIVARLAEKAPELGDEMARSLALQEASAIAVGLATSDHRGGAMAQVATAVEYVPISEQVSLWSHVTLVLENHVEPQHQVGALAALARSWPRLVNLDQANPAYAAFEAMTSRLSPDDIAVVRTSLLSVSACVPPDMLAEYRRICGVFASHASAGQMRGFSGLNTTP